MTLGEPFTISKPNPCPKSENTPAPKWLSKPNLGSPLDRFDDKLKLARAGEAREGDGVADVGDARHVADEALEAETVARVRDRAVAAQIHVPLKKREDM